MSLASCLLALWCGLLSFSFIYYLLLVISPRILLSVSLELLEDGTPKPPKDSMNDGLPKLYVNHNGFMKVLGCTLDVDVDNMKPVLYDPSGNVMDPNV